jgi:alkylhydroperoxidase family enzyme
VSALDALDILVIGAWLLDRAPLATLRQHFSEREIVELTAAIAAENFSNRFNVPLGIESQGFCAIPARPMATSRHAA